MSTVHESPGPVRTAIVGCGRIFPAYARVLTSRFRHLVDLVACADILPEAAKSRAKEFDIHDGGTVDDVLADESIELIIDLTNPGAHFEVSRAALLSGKHVFVEKPLATTRELGRTLVDTARDEGRLLAGAADTFLGPGFQTVRALIETGQIGVVAAATTMFGTGPMTRRYLSLYGGPLFDMGSYYVSALVSLFGSVTRVSASIREVDLDDGGTAAVEGPLSFPFETPAAAFATLTFVSGAIASLSLSGDTAGYFPRMEIFGSLGTIVANDPNGYCGVVAVRGAESGLTEVAVPGGFELGDRGLGVANLAVAIRSGVQPLASGELMYHVLDVLHSVRDSGLSGSSVEVASRVDRPDEFDIRTVMTDSGGGD